MLKLLDIIKVELMKYLLLLVLILSIATSIHCQSPCKGDYQTVLEKDSSLIVPCKNMVLMNLSAFTGYYYSKKNYDTLRMIIPRYQKLVDSIELEMEKDKLDYQRIISSQDQIIELETRSKEEVMSELVKVGQAYRREKKKNVWLKRIVGVTSIGLGITLIAK